MNLKKKKEGKWRVREDVFFFFLLGFFWGLTKSGCVCVCVCVLCNVWVWGGGGKGGGEEKNSLPLRFWEHFRKTLRF